jgi:leucyl/phenylalanyl-tRNA--protein transferase
MGRANESNIPTIDDVLAAYELGYFPMAAGPNGSIEFYYFEPRGIIPLDDRFTVRKSLRQIINRGGHTIKFDTQFEEVIRNCARHEKPRHEVWLSNDMIEIYLELHRIGIAHSVEVWSAGDESKLIGGLYGLTMGSAFLGESMFSVAPNASQIALVALVEHLRSRNFTLLDAQMSSDHLKQFGMLEISQREYLGLLNDALTKAASF